MFNHKIKIGTIEIVKILKVNSHQIITTEDNKAPVEDRFLSPIYELIGLHFLFFHRSKIDTHAKEDSRKLFQISTMFILPEKHLLCAPKSRISTKARN